MAITLVLDDGRSMRGALATLVELARQERNWCDNNGRGSKAEAWERIALAVEAQLEMTEGGTP